MIKPYGQSQNVTQQMMANQQALASYQIPQNTAGANIIASIIPMLGKFFEESPESNTKTKPKTKNPNYSTNVLGRIFSKNDASQISNPTTPKFMNY